MQRKLNQIQRFISILLKKTNRLKTAHSVEPSSRYIDLTFENAYHFGRECTPGEILIGTKAPHEAAEIEYCRA